MGWRGLSGLPAPAAALPSLAPDPVWRKRCPEHRTLLFRAVSQPRSWPWAVRLQDRPSVHCVSSEFPPASSAHLPAACGQEPLFTRVFSSLEGGPTEKHPGVQPLTFHQEMTGGARGGCPSRGTSRVQPEVALKTASHTQATGLSPL